MTNKFKTLRKGPNTAFVFEAQGLGSIVTICCACFGSIYDGFTMQTRFLV
jgi:hypothetical protein